MNKEKELVIRFGVLTFLFSIIVSSIYRIKKGLDADGIFSVFWLYCVGNHVLQYKQSGKKKHIFIAVLSFANAVLLMLMHCRNQHRSEQ